MKRWLLLLGGITFLASFAAQARTPVTYDAAMRDALLALPKIGARGLPDTDGKIVIVTFFASWCPPCKWEFQSLNALRKRYSERDLAIVAVNWFEAWGEDKGGKRMRRFLESTRPAFPLVSGTKAFTERFGGVTRIPTLFIFGRDGREAYSFIHLEGAEKMHAGTAELARVIEALR